MAPPMTPHISPLDLILVLGAVVLWALVALGSAVVAVVNSRRTRLVAHGVLQVLREANLTSRPRLPEPGRRD
jgi:hypothetical protein